MGRRASHPRSRDGAPVAGSARDAAGPRPGISSQGAGCRDKCPGNATGKSGGAAATGREVWESKPALNTGISRVRDLRRSDRIPWVGRGALSRYLSGWLRTTLSIYVLSLIHISEPTRQAEISYA